MQSLELDTPLSPRELDGMVETIAARIAKRRIEGPAVLFLEMHKPLSFVASQGLLVALPMIGPLIGADRMLGLSKLLRDRSNIEMLITRIEEKVAQRDAPLSKS